MFRRITRLIFGGEEEKPEEVMSGEVVEEEWLMVSHQDATSAETQNVEVPVQFTNCALTAETVRKQETALSVIDPQTKVPGSSSSSSSSSRARVISGFVQPKVLSEVTQFTCVHKAQSCANRHHLSRNDIQRQNRVRRGVLHPSFHLQQPGRRDHSH